MFYFQICLSRFSFFEVFFLNDILFLALELGWILRNYEENFLFFLLNLLLWKFIPWLMRWERILLFLLSFPAPAIPTVLLYFCFIDSPSVFLCCWKHSLFSLVFTSYHFLLLVFLLVRCCNYCSAFWIVLQDNFSKRLFSREVHYWVGVRK